jgi:hypothetical protein
MLRAQRDSLGQDAFLTIVRELVDEDSLRNLTEMLDQRPDSTEGDGLSGAAPGP